MYASLFVCCSCIVYWLWQYYLFLQHVHVCCITEYYFSFFLISSLIIYHLFWVHLQKATETTNLAHKKQKQKNTMHCLSTGCIEYIDLKKKTWVVYPPSGHNSQPHLLLADGDISFFWHLICSKGSHVNRVMTGHTSVKIPRRRPVSQTPTW